ESAKHGAELGGAVDLHRAIERSAASSPDERRHRGRRGGDRVRFEWLHAHWILALSGHRSRPNAGFSAYTQPAQVRLQSDARSVVRPGFHYATNLLPQDAAGRS